MKVNVTVIPVVDAPDDALILAPSGPFYENTTYIFSASSSDVDIPYGDILTYSWSLLPTGGSWNGTSIELNLTAGNYTLMLNVSDLYGAYTLDLMDLDIQPLVNQSDPDPDDDDEEPVDDDEEPVDDDEEPVDDDEEPIDDDEEPIDDDTSVETEEDPIDPLVLFILVPSMVGILLIAAIFIYVIIKRGSEDWEE